MYNIACISVPRERSCYKYILFTARVRPKGSDNQARNGRARKSCMNALYKRAVEVRLDLRDASSYANSMPATTTSSNSSAGTHRVVRHGRTYHTCMRALLAMRERFNYAEARDHVQLV
ncbi:hypothetical protein P5V15_008013 [Pogonomyrmex californicus]